MRTRLQVAVTRQIDELATTIAGDTPMLDEVDKAAIEIHLGRARSWNALGYTIKAGSDIAAATEILEEAI